MPRAPRHQDACPYCLGADGFHWSFCGSMIRRTELAGVHVNHNVDWSPVMEQYYCNDCKVYGNQVESATAFLRRMSETGPVNYFKEHNA